MAERSTSAILLIGVLLLGFTAGCHKPPATTETKPEWIDPAKVVPGPIQHDKLTEDQMSQIRHLQKVFAEVMPSSVEKWAEDFRRDLNPDNEIAIWENMAAAYEAYTSSRVLTLEAKKDVFQVVLLRSASSEEEVLKHLKLKTLTEKDAKEIMARYTAQPEPIKVASP